MASSDLCSLIFFLLYVRIFLFWCEGVKNFLGFADGMWSSWVEGVWVYGGEVVYAK